MKVSTVRAMLRFAAYGCFGWALPDAIRERWHDASLSLFAACLCFIALQYRRPPEPDTDDEL